MSHEIRTPMNGVIGMTDLLMETKLDDEQEEYLLTIKQSGDSLLSVINDILDFSKIEAGKLDIDNIPFDFDDSINSVIDIFRLKEKEKNVELFLHFDSSIPSRVIGDPGRIRQILINLVGNASKFTSHGQIEIRILLVSDNSEKVNLKIEVQDSGIGLTQESQSRLFQSFEQAENSTTRKFGGTGLGLAISKKLCELMGGEIGVNSEIRHGSTFWFTFTLEKQKEEINAPVSINLKDRHILVLDQNKLNLKIFHEMLTDTQSIVEMTTSMDTALSHIKNYDLQKQFFDIILIDKNFSLSEQDKIYSFIRDRQIGTRLILTSSQGTRGDARQAKENGFSAFLSKPIKRKQFIAVINEVLNLKKVSSPSIITKHSVQESQKKNFQILVAEDNKTNQKVISKLLEKMGYSFSIAQNGREAFEIYQSHHFDLILMDIQMPELNGFESTVLIREYESQNSIQPCKILALSANVMQEDIDQSLKVGMNAYLSKPVKRTELIAAFEKFLN